MSSRSVTASHIADSSCVPRTRTGSPEVREVNDSLILPCAGGHAVLRSAKQAMLDRLSRRGFTAKAQQACRCGMKVETRECVART